MADITLSWSRLMCPAWAARQAAPCRTEDVGDLQCAGAPPGSGARALAFHQQLEMLERAGHRPDRLCRDAGIERGRVELGMPEQDLDDADVDVLLEQMGGEAVAQRMGRDALLDAGRFRRLMDGAVELARRDRLAGCAGKQPAMGQHDVRGAWPSRHHCRSNSSSCGDSIALRSLRPLPCSTRISMRVLSMSSILSAATSETRAARHRRQSRARPCTSGPAPLRAAARPPRRSARSAACGDYAPGRGAATGPAGRASR